ncbi:hypothetical protein [Marivirga harenae]|uniref:hypothetical protein n=1 Tax=Marivirga harenae TaxID=2010992 RepID=UPI0026DF8EA0|nr:hypothetical protein [Marivirga harenae]WKV11263.1 hypothetical protein Q3Y49_13710 [Marivirga harenae]
MSKWSKQIIIISGSIAVLSVLIFFIYKNETTRLSRLETYSSKPYKPKSSNNTTSIDKNNSKPNEKSKSQALNYQIIESNRIKNLKYSLTIRLSKKISLTELKELAENLKNQINEPYERIFIEYYLPGMVVDKGAWAITHYTPDLNASILGMSAEEEKQLSSSSEKINADKVIGVWYENQTNSKMTIYSKSGKIFMQHHFNDGSNHTELLKKIKTSNGLVSYGPIGDIRFKEYYILNSNNDLEIHDEVEGLITTAKAINN